MFGALKLSKFGYTLKLLVNVVGELNSEKTAAASRGFLVTAQLSCINTRDAADSCIVSCI